MERELIPTQSPRLSEFIRSSGLRKFDFVVKSDQESPLLAMLEKAIEKSGREGIVVPENSAVGESAMKGPCRLSRISCGSTSLLLSII